MKAGWKSLKPLCCRLEVKSREMIENNVSLSRREVETCIEASGVVVLWVTHLVPVQVCSGTLWALGGSQSCTEFTGGWKGEGRTALPGDSTARQAGAVAASRDI